MTHNPPHFPYHAQWASDDRAADIIAGTLLMTEDPKWESSGAASPQEYATWANHVCGMACLKMIIESRSGICIPIMQLTRLALEFGAYTLEDGTIRGMIYTPFVTMIKAKFDIDAQVLTGLEAAGIAPQLRDGSMFIASVHPSIRWRSGTPPRKGGHLVLVTRTDGENLVFQNPSGHDYASQRDVVLPVRVFGDFFAGRGIRVCPGDSAESLSQP